MTSLIHAIQQAFSGVTLGNGIGLSEGNAMDDYAQPKNAPAVASKMSKLIGTRYL